jgi:molybdopterin molybdotransferase
LISLEAAQQAILATIPVLGARAIRIVRALGAVLAEDIATRYPVPRFDNSAVDGYGVRLADVENASSEHPASLHLRGTLAAGSHANPRIEAGEALKIMTGAPVPQGVEAVVMREYCQESLVSDHGTECRHVSVTRPARAGENIRLAGEEFVKGSVVLQAGTRITPPVIGLLASLGHTTCKVYRRPSVGLLITGNELVRPGRPLPPGKIYDSNSYALKAALQELGIEKVSVYRLGDTALATQHTMTQALKWHDVVISVGGISVGDFDFVKEVAETVGIETRFWGIALKPGKPMYFGLYPRKTRPRIIFGLPGNPVSALVTYQQLVQPALMKMIGRPSPYREAVTATLTMPLRKKPGRLELVRGCLSVSADGQTAHVTPAHGQDSHMMGGMAEANGLIHFPAEATELAAGEAVLVDRLLWR